MCNLIYDMPFSTLLKRYDKIGFWISNHDCTKVNEVNFETPICEIDLATNHNKREMNVTVC